MNNDQRMNIKILSFQLFSSIAIEFIILNVKYDENDKNCITLDQSGNFVIIGQRSTAGEAAEGKCVDFNRELQWNNTLPSLKSSLMLLLRTVHIDCIKMAHMPRS